MLHLLLRGDCMRSSSCCWRGCCFVSCLSSCCSCFLGGVCVCSSSCCRHSYCWRGCCLLLILMLQQLLRCSLPVLLRLLSTLLLLERLLFHLLLILMLQLLLRQSLLGLFRLLSMLQLCSFVNMLLLLLLSLLLLTLSCSTSI
jgi:hypothetical protein